MGGGWGRDDRGVSVATEVDPDEQLARELIAERHQIDLLELAWSRKAAEFARTDYWDAAGSVSAVDWLRHNCNLNETAAADRLAVGRRVDSLEESEKSMNQGKIGFAHLATLVRTAEAVGDAFEESKVLKQAEQNSPGRFFYLCRHYRHSKDKERYAERIYNAAVQLYLASGVVDEKVQREMIATAAERIKPKEPMPPERVFDFSFIQKVRDSVR